MAQAGLYGKSLGWSGLMTSSGVMLVLVINGEVYRDCP